MGSQELSMSKPKRSRPTSPFKSFKAEIPQSERRCGMKEVPRSSQVMSAKTKHGQETDAVKRGYHQMGEDACVGALIQMKFCFEGGHN